MDILENNNWYSDLNNLLSHNFEKKKFNSDFLKNWYQFSFFWQWISVWPLIFEKSLPIPNRIQNFWGLVQGFSITECQSCFFFTEKYCIKKMCFNEFLCVHFMYLTLSPARLDSHYVDEWSLWRPFSFNLPFSDLLYDFLS